MCTCAGAVIMHSESDTALQRLFPTERCRKDRKDDPAQRCCMMLRGRKDGHVLIQHNECNLKPRLFVQDFGLAALELSSRLQWVFLVSSVGHNTEG